MWNINKNHFFIFFIKYVVYTIVNVLFFSFFSISIYKIFCLYEDEISSILWIPDSINKTNFFSNGISNFFDRSIILHTSADSLLIELKINYIYSFDICYFFIYYICKDNHLFELGNYNYYNVFQIYFFTKVSGSFLYSDYKTNILFIFFCLHDYVLIFPYETALVFFRIENQSKYSIKLISMYIIYPIEYSYLLIKLQCFCFSDIFVKAFELIELPVIFYIDNDFNELLLRKMYFFYIIIPSVCF